MRMLRTIYFIHLHLLCVMHIGTCIFMSRECMRACMRKSTWTGGESICLLTFSLTIIFVPLFQVSPPHAYFCRWWSRVRSSPPISASRHGFDEWVCKKIKKKKTKNAIRAIINLERLFLACGAKNYGSSSGPMLLRNFIEPLCMPN